MECRTSEPARRQSGPAWRCELSSVTIIGAGPAGLAAANAAASCGALVDLWDDNPAPGGQIWRGRPELDPAAGVTLHCGRPVALAPSARPLILATGARERFLPFPGWTLPGVVGAGGLQALVKSGLPVHGQRVVIAGSGPLLLAVAALVHEKGAQVQLVAEQAPRREVAAFGRKKAMEALKVLWRLRSVPLRFGLWPVRAEGEGRVRAVVLSNGSRIDCDWLACGWGLVPNLELAQLLRCRVDDGAVAFDEFQQTSQAGIYAAGEVTGVGGVDKALVEGRIAGYAAAGASEKARALFAGRDRWRRFANQLNAAFALRPELSQLPDGDTVVCRCEDVRRGAIDPHESWRALKLQTRCGMGPCQGRVCGPAIEFLTGWTPGSVRPPIFPVPLRDLLDE